MTKEKARSQLAALYAQEGPKNMLHKTVEAQATTTELGEFSAIAAAYSVDRMNERIVPGAFKSSIESWQGSGKQIPLHWDHSGDARNIIGTVDPASMKETDQGLEVKGKLDLEESEIAREAWRSMKANRVALSFGYLVTADGKAEDGVRELKALDLFEVSITPAPANPDTHFIDMKSAGALPVAFPEDELEGARSGELKAVWTAAAINNLPDSSFLYVEGGGSKDSEGKTTPRSLRHFPVKDANGAVDLPHLRNALARIPQSNLSQAVKDKLTAKAQQMLNNANKAIEDARDEEPETAKSEAQDPLRKAYDELEHELSTRGIAVAEPPKVEEKEPEEDLPSLEELRRSYYDLMLETLTG